MNLMLATIFACVGLGLLVRQFGTRESMAVIAIASMMALLYLFQGTRFI
jgi:hypothetical protein